MKHTDNERVSQCSTCSARNMERLVVIIKTLHCEVQLVPTNSVKQSHRQCISVYLSATRLLRYVRNDIVCNCPEMKKSLVLKYETIDNQPIAGMLAKMQIL